MCGHIYVDKYKYKNFNIMAHEGGPQCAAVIARRRVLVSW